MDINQLKYLALSGESETLEFKKSVSQLRSACETVCAFLNGRGGIVLLGVTDGGRIVGRSLADTTQREIARELAKIEPTPQLDIYYVNLKSNKAVIVFKVTEGHHAPYIYDGRAFQRNQNTTERMSQHRYEQLLVKRNQLNYVWEEAIATEYALSDLDYEVIHRTVMDGITRHRIPAHIIQEKPERLLRRLNLMVDGSLKKAAVVLFAKEMRSGYLQCCLKMARFKGLSKSNDFIDNRQVHCHVFDMLAEVDHFINRHLPITSYFKPDEWQRKDKPLLPVLAVREAVVNAICHRDYTDRAGYISIAIFDDRLEIWNNGTLPGTLKISDLRRPHDSVLRNKLIANVFYLQGYIEAWGTGTMTMMNLCRKNGMPPVKFVERTGGLAVIFKFALSLNERLLTKTMDLTDRQREILNILSATPLNGPQLSKSLADTPSIRTVQKDLALLERAGLVQRKGKARSIVWHIVKKEN